jgi:hypothetical protein
MLEEFLPARPRHHRQRVTFLEVTAAADIILPLLNLCFRVVGPCTCHVGLAADIILPLLNLCFRVVGPCTCHGGDCGSGHNITPP